MVGVFLFVTTDACSSLPERWWIEFGLQAVVSRLFFPTILAGRFVSTVEGGWVRLLADFAEVRFS